ncbi:MAG: N-acetyltransferase, partial [Deltaproteobacteria bacterium]|nr:N-acetyltransferase [Deltaproteobacteria bacterium]
MAPGTSVVVRAVGSVAELPQAAWDALGHGASPFLKAGFLRALEESGSIDPLTARGFGPQKKRSGWTSVYLLAEVDGILVGGVAAFVKIHSYGEYIFDWGWASAAQRAGLEYYPKLVIAAPATPATGPRILLGPGLGAAAAGVRSALIAGVRAIADDTGCSSIHWLFCTAEEQAQLAGAGFFPRASYQFHWKNRGYATFDEFLGALTSRKRKQLRKERARAQGAIEKLAWVSGRDLDPARLDDLDRFYRATT